MKIIRCWERGHPRPPFVVPRAPRSLWTRTSLLPVLARTDRIEEQWISGQRLPAILRAKAEEDDAALAVDNFDQRGFALDAIAAEEPAGKERVFVFWIRSDDMNAGRWKRGHRRLVSGSRCALIADGDVRAPSA